MFLKGVSRRWFVNTIGITLLILIVFITAMSFTVRSFTYNSVNQVLTGRANELLNVLYSRSGGYETPSEFAATTRDYIEDFPDKGLMEIMSINPAGTILATSTGFEPDSRQQMPDFTEAMNSADNSGYWAGRLDSGEKVMAITRVVTDTEGDTLGSVRYIVSMEKADQQLFIVIMSLITAGLVIMLVIVLSGAYFLRSIVVPIRQVNETAEQIAQGDFDVRIESPKNRDDEIARLCETINNMAEELGASEQMKNDFISSVSHELRTPLTSIKGWAETLQLGANKETAEKGMGVISREAERLSGIVEELLDFSKLQSGRMNLNLKEIDLSAEVGDIVYMFTDRAFTEHKEITYTDSSDMPLVLGDNDKLRQVFINIMDNALKYTEENGKVSVKCELSEDESHIDVVLSDTGCGIPKEHLQNIKKKFYKANQLVRGSGIGLAVADELVTLHYGTLQIDSEENVGTTVTVSLPTMQYLQAHPELKAEMDSALVGELTASADTSEFPKITGSESLPQEESAEKPAEKTNEEAKNTEKAPSDKT